MVSGLSDKLLCATKDAALYKEYHGILTTYLTEQVMAILADGTDELPESYHSALILYAVGRERSMGDGTSMASARACFELYAAKRRSLIQNYGNLDTRFYNCF